jgi:hypothetical protein
MKPESHITVILGDREQNSPETGLGASAAVCYAAAHEGLRTVLPDRQSR